MSTIAPATAAGITWDLSALFEGMDDPKIAATWISAHDRADNFATQYRGKLNNINAAQLAKALATYEDISNEASKPITFAHLLFAGDTSDPKIGAFMQEQTEKSSELSIKVMFFDLELQQIPEDQITALLKDSVLDQYAHHINKVRIYTPYTLDESKEILLEETSNTGLRAWQRLHDEVTANHVFRYTDPETNEIEELSQEEVLDKLRDPNRKIRESAANAFTAGLKELERVIAYTYNTILADKKLEDRLRTLEYAEQSRHLANELDKETVDLVMQLCKERSDVVERYYNVKKHILKLDELTHIDRYAPLFESKEEIAWPKAKEIVIASFSQFHKTLAQRAEEFFDKNWIDAEPRTGKTGGAFCSYNTPDTHPVILMTYLGKLTDIGTLAHELGHGVHSSLSRKQNLYNFHGTLPLAELASIFAEILVFEDLVKNASTQDALALYADKIEGIFASVHRQSAMFRFEQRCHNHRRDKGELSTEDFQNHWQEELQAMFGEGVKLGEQHKIWWLYVGHFFAVPFYVYAYSFGELLTLALYEKAKVGGPEFANKYIEVLERGGSETPQELMAHLGVDLKSKEFWQGGFEVIDRLVGEFEKLWEKHNA
ncbi:MAG: M3 family oligoendopeptidase [Fimbriimonadaceae bacterium]